LRYFRNVLHEGRDRKRLFLERRNLFSSLDCVFFDTTSIYFKGEGGETIGQLGHTKDHRPDLHQMVVGVILDDHGQPVCSEMWPGNTTDVTTLIPVIKRLRSRFAIGRICVVSDRGMISAETMAYLEEEKISYILGAWMRRRSSPVPAVTGRFIRRVPAKDPSPLKVKEVIVDGNRYIVCLNEKQARKDAADRQAIIDPLQETLKTNPKALVGNKGYRKYLKLDRETIRGHVFWSFLALVIRKELDRRLEKDGHCFEWAALSFILTSFVKTPLQFYLVYGVLLGIGSAGMGVVVCNPSVGKWFIRKRGLAIGITTMGISFGTIALTPMSGFIVENHGWQSGFLFLGIVTLFIGVTLSQLLLGKTRPEDYGLLPDGEKNFDLIIKIHSEQHHPIKLPLQKLGTDSRFWIIGVCYSLAVMTMITVFVHQVAYALDNHIGKIAAASALGVIGLTGFCGQFFSDGFQTISEMPSMHHAWD
jgi:MFS family permease